ncbi:MAG: nucleotidyltransferase domain-containing protein [Flavobacteriales bacterium]|nr:nucleotidyltransferase domain-containing protein [Flavobacteriales bacterium]
MLSTDRQRLIREVLAPYDPKLIAVFGSRARGDQRNDSDLDLLVDLTVPVDFLELVGIQQSLTEKLGMPVDLVSDRAVDPKLRPYIQRDMVRIDARA